MSLEVRLEKFVRRVTHTHTGYTRLMLVQAVVGGNSRLLREFPLDLAETVYDAEKVSEIVAETIVTAQEDADGHSGLTSYCLQALRGVTRGESSAVFRLRRQHSDFDDEALGETEPATKDGHLAQLMRHNEALIRTLVQQQEVMSNQSTAIIARLTEQVKHYDERHWETMLRAEELADERDRRETQKLLTAGKEKRMDEALKTFKPLVPVLVSKLRGVPADAKAALNVEAIKAIMSNLSPDKMEQIANILGRDSVALLELWIDANKDNPEVQEPKH